jgi:phospholipase C
VFGDLKAAFDFESATDSVPALPSVGAYKPSGTPSPSYHPVPPANGSVPKQESGVRPSRRLGYRFDVEFRADSKNLKLAVKNRGGLGVYLQARSLTVAGGPYTYTIGAGHELAIKLANPGTYGLSLYGPNGFFRHYAGSPRTAITVQETMNVSTGVVKLVIHAGGSSSGRGRHHRPVTIRVADAYGRDFKAEVDGGAETLVDTDRSGGWYDLALTSPDDASFRYQLAGRVESSGRLTSDPQFGRA